MSGWTRKLRRKQAARENKQNGHVVSTDDLLQELTKAYELLLRSPVEGIPREQFQALVVLDIFMGLQQKTGRIKNLGEEDQILARLCGKAFYNAQAQVGNRIIIPQ